MLRDVEERAELTKKSLQRLYNEIDKLPASEGYFVFDKYVERYNIILSDAKKIFSDKRLIQEQREINHPPDRMGAFES